MKSHIALLATCLILAADVRADDAPVFQWSNRPELTAEQQQLLRLYHDRDGSTDRAEQARLADSVKHLAVKLGANAVRPAKPGEITVTRLGETDTFAVRNPSKEAIALTIAVKGDEQRIGSRMGSIGRLTYLPPSGMLIVPKLYWTTPRTDHK